VISEYTDKLSSERYLLNTGIKLIRHEARIAITSVTLIAGELIIFLNLINIELLTRRFLAFIY